MIRAYDGIYLEDAMQNFAVMMDYGAQICPGGMDGFYDRLLASNAIRQFESGNPRYLAGMSGIELANEVIFTAGDSYLHPRKPLGYFLDRVVVGLSPMACRNEFREP